VTRLHCLSLPLWSCNYDGQELKILGTELPRYLLFHKSRAYILSHYTNSIIIYLAHFIAFTAGSPKPQFSKPCNNYPEVQYTNVCHSLYSVHNIAAS